MNESDSLEVASDIDTASETNVSVESDTERASTKQEIVVTDDSVRKNYDFPYSFDASMDDPIKHFVEFEGGSEYVSILIYKKRDGTLEFPKFMSLYKHPKWLPTKCNHHQQYTDKIEIYNMQKTSLLMYMKVPPCGVCNFKE